MNEMNFGGVTVKAWTDHVPFEEQAQQQVAKMSRLPIVKGIAIMPDVHLGIGATVGSVVVTAKALIPAAVGVDIGCGMEAIRTSLTSKDLPESLSALRGQIERDVPHGAGTGKMKTDGHKTVPDSIGVAWQTQLNDPFKQLLSDDPELDKANHVNHLGTLGGGNHFIEVCLDKEDRVWIMLHSGSRGIGNAIGSKYIKLAREEAERGNVQLENKDLAYLDEDSQYFGRYVRAVSWAQKFAKLNRKLMMERVLRAVRRHTKEFTVAEMAVSCHHNYIEFAENGLYITRKGAVSAKKGELGIIPGSMGARSFIVRGLGNEESFHSCSHGAGRVMSRGEAKQKISLADHIADTAGVECKKDTSVLDESPKAYKDIDAVMRSQQDLVEILYELKQILCVKG